MSIDNIILNGWKLFLWDHEQNVIYTLHFYSHNIGIFRAIKQEKGVKSIKIGRKEIKWSVCR